MIEPRAYVASSAGRFSSVRHGLCAAALLLGLLHVSSVMSLPAATSYAHSALKSAHQLDRVDEAGASRGANSRPVDRATLQKGTLLVASRYLADPNFARAVVLLVNYGARGAMGLIINRRTGLSLGKVLPAIAPLLGHQDRLYVGGPVAQEQVLLLFRTDRQPKNTAHVVGHIFFGASEDSLREVLSRSKQGERFHAYLGYAGWGPGQLEDEVSRGDWHLVSADAGTAFDAEPSDIWHDLLRQSTGLWVRRGGDPFLRHSFETARALIEQRAW